MPTDYSYLLDAYPKEISMDQLYQICHFSKRKCRWLLEQGYIPCVDTGKKTRRFKIQTEDVVKYLTKLETQPQKAAPPVGIFSSKCPVPYQAAAYRSASIAQLRKQFSNYWKDEPEALEMDDMIKLTGYSYQTIHRWLIKGDLKYVTAQCGRVVAKKWLIEWLVAYTHIKGSRLSAQHKQIVIELNHPVSPASAKMLGSILYSNEEIRE